VHIRLLLFSATGGGADNLFWVDAFGEPWHIQLVLCTTEIGNAAEYRGRQRRRKGGSRGKGRKKEGGNAGKEGGDEEREGEKEYGRECGCQRLQGNAEHEM